MGIQALDRLGHFASRLSQKTWETASDWDTATDELGVVHAGFGDNPGDDVITLGYPEYDSNGSALEGYWPLHEDSGSTANEVSGNSSDASYVNSPTLGQTGILGKTAPNFDDANNEYVSGSLDATDSFTISLWYKSDQSSWNANGTLWSARSANGFIVHNNQGSKSISLYLMTDGGSATKVGSFTPTPDITTLTHLAWSYDGSGNEVRINGSEVLNNTDTATRGSSNIGFEIASDSGGSETDDRYEDGNQLEYRFYQRALSGSELASLYNGLFDGYLQSATKSFKNAYKPALTGLSYALNAGSVDIDVIGSPGTTSEEVVNSGSLNGTETSATLSWSTSHTDFQIRPNLHVSQITDQPPTVSSVSLS